MTERTHKSVIKVTPSSDTPSSLDFSKQELSELADYLLYAREHIREYAEETAQRYPGLPIIGTLREYADRAELYRRRVRSLVQ